MDDLSYLINKWEGHCATFEGTTYISDLFFDDHFNLEHDDAYIAAVFEYLEGEYGLDRDIYFENLQIDKPLLFNFRELQMCYITDTEILEVINKYKLTIYNETIFATNSKYLIHICYMLFTKYKYLNGLQYIFKNLIYIISYILPNYISYKKPITEDWISMPFSLDFITVKNINIKYYHSQIVNTTYSLCPKKN
ncbi:hypothetical protein MrNuV_ORF076 [Macrobrachium rosenbergii nudivirus]|nr:hypothetical protein MrNuV_ORF076 [Macrobrachium rosenbergii nudivirus]